MIKCNYNGDLTSNKNLGKEFDQLCTIPYMDGIISAKGRKGVPPC